MKYQFKAKFVSLLFSSCIMHLIHFNSMFTCSSLNPLLMHMGFTKCNSNCIWVHLKWFIMSTSYFDAPIKYVMNHPMLVHYAMLLIVRLSSLFVCFFSNRRRRWDRRGLREQFRGVSSVPGYWVCRQVFTHMNHCFRLTTGYPSFRCLSC